MRSEFGEITVTADYGQHPESRVWLCPLRQQWGLSARQQLTPGFSEKLWFTVTATGSDEEAAQVACKWGDGAPWIWNLQQDRWGGAIGLLDFYHGSQHLWALGQTLHGEEQPALTQWVEPRLHRLRHGDEKKVLGEIRRLKPRRSQAGRSQAREQNYFANHAGRMNYRSIAWRGWPIGSGAVESACRQKQCRFKRSGQFWTSKGLRHLCALVEARRNHHWDQLWQPA